MTYNESAGSKNAFPLPELVFVPIHDWIEDDTVIIIKQDSAWQALQPHDLDWDIGIELEAPPATETAFKRLTKQCKDMGDILYAVGGGVAADAAKYVARELELPLICVPTALSADAFFSWSSAVRDEGATRFLETVPPEIVLLDLNVIASAPAYVRAAGVVDVLSIATATHDWQLAEQRGKNPAGQRYDIHTANIAKGVLAMVMDAAEAAGRGDAEGLRSMVNAMTLGVQLCNLMGHTRLKEGSEHQFAYCAEMLTSAESLSGQSPVALHTHAELVGPGLVLMGERQGQDAQPLRKALDGAGVPMNALTSAEMEATLRELPAYVRKYDQPYSIAWEL